MLSAIVYHSLTGSCKRYAELLSARLHIPCHELGKGYVRSDGKVLYVGWVRAGKVVGYPVAAKVLNVAAVAAVGMSPVTPGSEAAGRRANRIPDDVAYFPLQGGFHLNKLSKGKQAVMRLINRGIARKLRAKGSLSPQEQATYRMAVTGDGEPAEWDVSAILDWCRNN